MSSKIIPDDKRVVWHLLLKVKGIVKKRVEEAAYREGRSPSFFVSRLLERYYNNEK